jgi:hypothetical protein
MTQEGIDSVDWRSTGYYTWRTRPRRKCQSKSFRPIAFHSFEAGAKKLLTEEDRRELELALVADPKRGKVIERTGGFRKVRFARPSRREGKRGGTLVIYYLLDRRDRIYLLLVYAKGVKDNLTRAEENELRKLAKALEEEEI